MQKQPMQLPFWERVEKANKVLLAGCGGGFDIYQGMPLYRWALNQCLLCCS
jgi:hypothetical protein